MLDDALGSGKQIDIEQSSTIQQLSIRIENNLDKCLINMNMTGWEHGLQGQAAWSYVLFDEIDCALIPFAPSLSAGHSE